MKFAVRVALGNIIYVPCLMLICSWIQIILKILPQQFDMVQCWHCWWEELKKPRSLDGLRWHDIVTCISDFRQGFGLNDWIYCTLYIHTVRDYGSYSAIAILHALQFTVARALGFSVFTSRILATDLSQSHYKLNSHMKSSLHHVIPFLRLLLSHLRLPSPELDPILILAAWDPRYIACSRIHRKRRFLCCCEGMFSESLPSNGYTRHNIHTRYVVLWRLVQAFK
jgi:hypothetical protein